MGPQAVLVEDLHADPAAWSLGVRSLGLPDVIDVVPGAASVLVTFATAASCRSAVGRLAGVVPAADDDDRPPVEIAVRYDGADLDDVAAATGLTVAQVIAVHAAATYEVAFCGFAPGFAYLRGLDPRLHLPRRATPRTTVPAGSVAIAAGYSAVYPRSSPGGWHLLGTTGLVMFDPSRDPPAMLAPRTHVRFVPA